MADLLVLLAFIRRLSRGVPFAVPLMVGVMLAGVASGLASTALVVAINTAISRGGPGSGLGWRFVALCAMLPAFRMASQVLLLQLSQHSLLQARLQLTRRVLAAPLRQLEGIGPHRLMTVLTNDIAQIVEALAQLPVLFMHLAVVLGCLGYIAWLSPTAFSYVILFLVLGVTTYHFPVGRAMVFFGRVRKEMDEFLKNLRALTEGTKELKMHRLRREAYLEGVETNTEAMQREAKKGGILFALASSWGQVLFFILVGLMVFVVPRGQEMPQATLVGLALVLFQLMAPLEVLLSTLPLLGRSVVSARAIERLGLSLAQEASEAPGAGRGAFDRDWGALELDGLCHTYRGEGQGGESESFTLGPVDLSFTPGEIVFLVGGNGSGKTTLAKILLGLYPPEAGEIRFSGRPVTDGNRADYRDHFAVVFSDFFLFERIAGAGARGDELDADALRYLERLRLTSKVRVEGGRLSTIELSQGQKKRLALLAAYLEDRPIYLFDEWAADQDPFFKQIFYRELLPELKTRGKTVFVISHDDHYYDVADRLIKLDAGKVEFDVAKIDPAAMTASFARTESARV
ncbi:MAG TPA: cyclic peptide export ABC transporter [Thermoanaerobaculia bacterium]|jgi:putative ATP-binding cassette transporter|nr:cyclic peptide export ABC transporter [Thermoanaerobaculia bacterium]